MSQYWENVAGRTDGQYTADEFQSTASRLLMEQVLYHADRGSRVAYGMVEGFERDFKHVLSQVGVGLIVNRQLRYACAIPDNGKAGTATVNQTLLALVLRRIYDEQARVGQQNDDGEVACDLVELVEKYRMMVKRELPGRGELDALLKMLRRWGLVRKVEDAQEAGLPGMQEQPYVLMIRPAIVDMLGETAIAKLAQFDGTAPQEEAGDEDDDNDAGEDTASEAAGEPS
jgi:hypothetical protein